MTGRYAFRLLFNGAALGSGTAALGDLGLADGSVVMLMKEPSRNYALITAPEFQFRSDQYPNGLTFDRQGRLLVAHYFGLLQVWDASFTTKLSQGSLGGSQPSQICIAPGGELLVAFRSGYVQMMDAEDLSPKGPQLRPREGRFSPSGVAVVGDRVFVSCARTSMLHQFSLTDGSHLDQRKGGAHWELMAPNGMAVIEDRVLAIADRGLHRVLLLDTETLELRGQVPDVETWRQQAGPAALKKPNDVAVDAAGNLLVMDTQNERVAVFRQDGTLVASVMEGFFKDKGNTFSYLACNHDTGHIAISNNDEHRVAVLAPP
ncbi:trim71 [Symbiodinium natans]|uniref:Trim71 protein n=1 Tax=Symbiodinium natans TaxID=878477 RepID=A0A812LJ81_9DINO|nr:trim71 [Symbiodinium natans]